MSVITITLTTTISQVGISLPATSSDVSDVTVSVLISTSSVPLGASDSESPSSSAMSLSSVLPSTLAPSSITTGQPELVSSATTSKINLKSLISSPTASLSGTNDLDGVQNPSTVPDALPPENGLSRGQITAIIASVVSVTVILIAIFISVRCFVIRRRSYQIEELPKRNLGRSSDDTESRTEQGCKSEIRTSVADSNRSSIWGDIGGSVVPNSLSDDVWDSRHWPLPPGHSERYTFFSERSSTSVDETLETEQRRGGGQTENWNTRNTRDHNPTATERESGTRSRCDSIWGISDVGIAH
ncbi:hypothetical protein F4781DRAFT_247720 [Annulohypoxylon bovei var. microspora]|nr:hypothetical protein F4781DRAFT_247720 [Annulohypoxylon bovei var. microspora]